MYTYNYYLLLRFNIFSRVFVNLDHTLLKTNNILQTYYFAPRMRKRRIGNREFFQQDKTRSVSRYRVRPAKYSPLPLTRCTIPSRIVVLPLFFVSSSSEHEGMQSAPPSHVTTPRLAGVTHRSERDGLDAEKLPLRARTPTLFLLSAVAFSTTLCLIKMI